MRGRPARRVGLEVLAGLLGRETGGLAWAPARNTGVRRQVGSAEGPPEVLVITLEGVHAGQRQNTRV